MAKTTRPHVKGIPHLMADSRQFVHVMASKRVPNDHKLVKNHIKKLFMSGDQAEIAGANSETSIVKRRLAFRKLLVFSSREPARAAKTQI